MVPLGHPLHKRDDFVSLSTLPATDGQSSLPRSNAMGAAAVEGLTVPGGEKAVASYCFLKKKKKNCGAQVNSKVYFHRSYSGRRTKCVQAADHLSSCNLSVGRKLKLYISQFPNISPAKEFVKC